MKRIVLMFLAVCLFATPAMAIEGLSVEPMIGGSFGIAQQSGSLGGRLSYWAGSISYVVNENMSVWIAMQRTIMTDADLDGVGPKFLLVIKSDERERWSLLAGGGWLTNFNPGFGGDAAEDALTMDGGVMYEFLKEKVFVGALGSAINTRIATDVGYKSRLDWSVDLGIIGRF